MTVNDTAAAAAKAVLSSVGFAFPSVTPDDGAHVCDTPACKEGFGGVDPARTIYGVLVQHEYVPSPNIQIFGGDTS